MQYKKTNAFYSASFDDCSIVTNSDLPEPIAFTDDFIAKRRAQIKELKQRVFNKQAKDDCKPAAPAFELPEITRERGMEILKKYAANA